MVELNSDDGSEAYHKCPDCGKDVPDIRTDLLGVLTCVSCTPQAPKPLGVMEYDEKTGGCLFITDNPEVFRALKQVANERR